MADPFLAEIRIFPFNFAPKGWAFCAGQLMSISQNTALFSLLGTMYGGDGVSNFALPNLQGRVPIGFGQGPGLTQRDQGVSEAMGIEIGQSNRRESRPEDPSDWRCCSPVLALDALHLEPVGDRVYRDELDRRVDAVLGKAVQRAAAEIEQRVQCLEGDSQRHRHEGNAEHA